MPSKIRRKSKHGVCKYCCSEFQQYSFEDKDFCSRNCFYNSVRDKRPKHNCVVCGMEIKTTQYRHARNEEYYCNRICYNNRRKQNLKRLKRHTEYFDKLLENSACECGVSEKYLLQIHHKDGDKRNNINSNLEVVCANCHIKRHLRRNEKGELVYHTKSLTKPEDLQLILEDHGKKKD